MWRISFVILAFIYIFFSTYSVSYYCENEVVITKSCGNNQSSSESVDDISVYKTKNNGYGNERSRRVFWGRELLFDSRNISAVIFTTSDSLGTKFINTLQSFRYFQERFNVKAVIFTDSTKVENYCKSMNISTLATPAKNRYNLPVFSAMLKAARASFHYDFYIFINSDILVNPYIFLLLPLLRSTIPSPVSSVYLPRVVVTREIPDAIDYYDSSLFDSLDSNTHHLRNIWQTDIFVFSRDYPVESIPPVVVGRWGIDAAILIKAHRDKIPVVDLSNLRSYHQGVDASETGKKKLERDNWDWNWRFITKRQAKVQGALTSDYLVQSQRYRFYSRGWSTSFHNKSFDFNIHVYPNIRIEHVYVRTHSQ